MTTPVLDQIRSTDWQPRLGQLGAIVEGLDDVAQCVRTIVTTQRGTVPHRPLFGVDLHGSLDAPTGVAAVQLQQQCAAAVARWEPRADVVAVEVAIGAGGAALTITIRWRPRGGSGTTSLLVAEVPA